MEWACAKIKYYKDGVHGSSSDSDPYEEKIKGMVVRVWPPNDETPRCKCCNGRSLVLVETISFGDGKEMYAICENRVVMD